MKYPTSFFVAGPVLLLALGMAAQAPASSLSKLREKLQAASATTATSTNTSTTSQATAALSQSDVAAGLKEALATGATQAISSLGRTDGFWRNSDYRIPLPGALAKSETLLRQLGQGARVDDFHLSLNRAAEQAVPVAAELIGDSIKTMSLADARSILAGGNDAATQYFRRQAGPALRERFLPLVGQATDQVGVTKRYKEFTSASGGSAQGLGALVSQLGGAAGGSNAAALDLDGYVADQALDALFNAIAEQEREIRANPLARGTELLKKVFSR